jgi:hypothetical protein
LGDLKSPDFKVIISVCPKMARGKREKDAQKDILFLGKKDKKGNRMIAPTHPIYYQKMAAVNDKRACGA